MRAAFSSSSDVVGTLSGLALRFLSMGAPALVMYMDTGWRFLPMSAAAGEPLTQVLEDPVAKLERSMLVVSV